MEGENKQTNSANDCCECCDGGCSNCGSCGDCCELFSAGIMFGWLFIWNCCGCEKCC